MIVVLVASCIIVNEDYAESWVFIHLKFWSFIIVLRIMYCNLSLWTMKLQGEVVVLWLLICYFIANQSCIACWCRRTCGRLYSLWEQRFVILWFFISYPSFLEMVLSSCSYMTMLSMPVGPIWIALSVQVGFF